MDSKKQTRQLYIVLSQTGTLLSRLIRYITGAEYNHASISMSEDLEKMYSCYHKSRKLCKCDGQTTYQADRVDETIRQIIRKIFSCMDGAPEEEKLQLEIGKTLTGDSIYSPEDLSQAIQTIKSRITEAEIWSRRPSDKRWPADVPYH